MAPQPSPIHSISRSSRSQPRLSLLGPPIYRRSVSLPRARNRRKTSFSGTLPPPLPSTSCSRRTSPRPPGHRSDSPMMNPLLAGWRRTRYSSSTPRSFRRIPGLVAMELPKSPASHVAAFVPESKGIPASVQIFSCEKNLQSQVVARRSFFRCSSVQMLWNHRSTGLLVEAQLDVDKSNQSDYGQTKLNYLTTDGSHGGHVPLRKGPVHDVHRSSLSTEFAVVDGFMLAMVTVFDKKCNPIFELGTGPYNTLRWNPRGESILNKRFSSLMIMLGYKYAF